MQANTQMFDDWAKIATNAIVISHPDFRQWFLARGQVIVSTSRPRSKRNVTPHTATRNTFCDCGCGHMIYYGSDMVVTTGDNGRTANLRSECYSAWVCK